HNDQGHDGRVPGQLVNDLNSAERLLVYWSRRVRITYLGVYDIVKTVSRSQLTGASTGPGCSKLQREIPITPVLTKEHRQDDSAHDNKWRQDHAEEHRQEHHPHDESRHLAPVELGSAARQQESRRIGSRHHHANPVV